MIEEGYSSDAATIFSVSNYVKTNFHNKTNKPNKPLLTRTQPQPTTGPLSPEPTPGNQS